MAWHKNRQWSITAVDHPSELAEKLNAYSWTLCTGFSHDGILYLNDSFCEDSAQEYSIIEVLEAKRDESGNDTITGSTLDSITASWLTKEELEEHIKALGAETRRETFGGGAPVTLTVQQSSSHPKHCSLCA